MLAFIFLVTVVVTFFALSGGYFCISMLSSYSGIPMGNEASGFFQFGVLLTLVFSVLAVVLWVWVIKLLKK